MTTSILAGPGDTWGIAGPDFLWLYAGPGVLSVVAAFIWRRSFLRGPSLRRAGELTATQAALLNGDRRLAVYSSLAALRTAGAVDTNGTQLRQVNFPPTGASELDRAVYAAAGRGVTAKGAQSDAAVNDVLNRTEAELAASGWILDKDGRRNVKMGALIVFAVVAIGVARIIAGIMNEKSVIFLTIMTGIVFFIGLGFRSAPRVSTNGKRMLSRMRTKAYNLSPSHAPAYETYGPAAAAMGVGLFGAAALWAADPGFAEAAEVERHVAGSSGISSAGSYGGDSGSSSSSCSSSSSSCSGGSSCGGGGGGCGG